MRFIVVFKSSLFLFLLTALANAVPMDEQGKVFPGIETREDRSLNRERSASSTSEFVLTATSPISPTRTAIQAIGQGSQANFLQDQELSTKTQVQRSSLSLKEPFETPVVISITSDRLPVSEIIKMASQKRNEALAIAGPEAGNSEASADAEIAAAKRQEFQEMVDLWNALLTTSDKVLEKSHQIEIYIDRPQASSPWQELLEEKGLKGNSLFSEEGVFDKDELRQVLRENIDNYKRAMEPHEKRVDFGLKYTTIIDSLTHERWSKYPEYALRCFKGEEVNDSEMEQVGEDENYKMGVARLLILATNYCMDENKRVSSFLEKTAMDEYSSLQDSDKLPEEERNKTMVNNKKIVYYCSWLDTQRQKIQEDKNLLNQAEEGTQEKSEYAEAIAYREKACETVISIVKRLKEGRTDVEDLQSDLDSFSTLASNLEVRAKKEMSEKIK